MEIYKSVPVIVIWKREGFRQGEIRVSPNIERGEAYQHGERNRVTEGRDL
jgi:hypothetical protein